MTILLPHTRLHPATARLANAYAPSHRRVRLDPADDSAYCRLLTEHWRQPGPLMVIEHDIGIHAGVVEELAACLEPWCGHPYLIGTQLLVCLGCTRFSAALKLAEPDLMDAVSADATGGLPAGDWRRLDVRILDHLRRRGYKQHEHQQPVKHYHRYPG